MWKPGFWSGLIVDRLPWIRTMRLATLLFVGLWLGLTPTADAHETSIPSADTPAACSMAKTAVASASSPLLAGFFQDVVGNRSRIIQASFICIAIGIFILWKK
jgi:hypothetical protein